MIRINLLSSERSKKTNTRVESKSQVIYGLLLLIIMSGLWLYGWKALHQSVEQLQAEKTDLVTELATLKLQSKEVENYETDKKKVKEKIQIIQQLRKNQSIPVYLLDEISKRLPERVWLIHLTERSGIVDLSGKATTNSEIVDFINNLKEASLFKDVQILESRQKKEGNVIIYSFRLKWSIFS